MVCFCKDTAKQLADSIEALRAASAGAASPGGSASGGGGSEPAAGPAGAANETSDKTSAGMKAVAGRLLALGLPAKPWTPDPAWRDAVLPVPALPADALATLAALVGLRASVMAQFGIDLAVPEKAAAFTRLASTLASRLNDMAGSTDVLARDAQAWSDVAATAGAADKVAAAIKAGTFEPAASPAPEAAADAWKPFLDRLKALMPVVSMSAQLGVPPGGNIPAALAAVIGPMLKTPVPRLPAGALAVLSTLASSLAAKETVRNALGIDPSRIPVGHARAAAAERARDVAKQAGGLEAMTRALERAKPAANPGSFATPDAVARAMAIDPGSMAALNWRVPPAASLPALTAGAPLAALARRLGALGMAPSARPCAGCDAVGAAGAAAA